ncbi:RanGTP-binding protein-domain-containing protein [Jimgerdemannia flammicorona]|uniref:RanGTP-binding protein-domain-containing protein n=1 Tax=Jimgerdemannia flammicorona TaxID=994334 RepID=A0A433PSC3_9FUNG|nr:RanGTP-binding protein-domain-containing protein [Jimgerdemannia flammicorona]
MTLEMHVRWNGIFPRQVTRNISTMSLEDVFGKLAISTFSVVGKAAFGAAASVAMRNVADYIASSQTQSSTNKEDIVTVKERLENKIRAVTPAIDLIEMVSARGNTGLESVLAMSTQLRISIAHFGRTLESFNTLLLADSLETSTRARLTRSFSRERQQALDVANVVQLMRALADRIDDIVPFLTLAIAASGATYGWSLPQSVSPSRLLQASSALADADRRARARGGSEPVGPVFKSKLYSMFQASARPKAAVDFTWKEEFSKCEVRVWRKEVGQRAGGRKDGTVNGITKGFEGGEAEPFVTPRKPKNWSTADGENGWGFKVDWLALEAYHPDDGSEEEDEDESEEDEDESEEEHDTEDDGETEVDDEEATEHVDGQDDEPNRKDAASSHRRPSFSASESTTAIASPPPLSLLEYLIRLSALEVSEQTSHLDISDEKINLFLRVSCPPPCRIPPFSQPSMTSSSSLFSSTGRRRFCRLLQRRLRRTRAHPPLSDARRPFHDRTQGAAVPAPGRRRRESIGKEEQHAVQDVVGS